MADPPPFGRPQQLLILLAAFAAWMFAGLEISHFQLIHRQMIFELIGKNTSKSLVIEWFTWFQATFLFGAAAGGWLFGWFGDRFGRTRALGVSVLCYSSFTLGCYFVTDVTTMLSLRFLACLGIGGVWPNAVALVAEAWPDASRPLLSGLLGTAANFGFVLIGVIGYCIPITQDAWRWVLLVGSAPAILGVAILSGVPESARWLASRTARAASTTSSSPILEVLRPPLLSRTLLGIALGAIPVVGSAANASYLIPWSDEHQESRTLSMDGQTQQKPAPDPRSKAETLITRSGGAVFGSLLGGIVAGLVGRRLSYFLISLATLAVSTYIFLELDPSHKYFPIFTFVFGFVGVTYFGWLPLFLPELFPTRVRATGSGISFNTGRVVAGIVVLSTGVLLTLFPGGYAQVGLWSGMIYAVGMIVIWFAPRRTGNRLED